LTPRARLTFGLLGLAALAGTALALGMGRPPRRENPGVAALRREIGEESRFPGRRIFSVHKCVVCHGADGGGTEMGPGLGSVMPEYLAAAGGDEAAARGRLAAYLKSPQGVPTLRRDTTRYQNPMPSAQGLGLTDEQVDQVAEYILHLRPPAQAVGGDAQGR
jgi:mono/diheme cytochrome c family protein